MPFDIASALGSGAQAAASGIIPDIAGMGLGLLGNVLGQQQQYKQAQKLQGLQIAGNEQLMDYSENKQFDLWNKTNYPAQVQQLEKAGLNPALLYGHGGSGGVTGSPMGATTGQQAIGGTQAATQGMGIMSQQALLDAQRKNIEADTKIKETYIPQIVSETNLNDAKTGNVNLDSTLKQIQARIDTVRAKVAEGTVEEQIGQIVEDYQQSIEMAMQAGIKTFKDRATANTLVDTIRAQYVGTLIENNLKKTGIQVNEMQIKQMANNIAIGWEQLDVNQKQQKLNQWTSEWEKKLGNSKMWVDGISRILPIAAMTF